MSKRIFAVAVAVAVAVGDLDFLPTVGDILVFFAGGFSAAANLDSNRSISSCIVSTMVSSFTKVSLSFFSDKEGLDFVVCVGLVLRGGEVCVGVVLEIAGLGTLTVTNVFCLGLGDNFVFGVGLGLEAAAGAAFGLVVTVVNVRFGAGFVAGFGAGFGAGLGADFGFVGDDDAPLFTPNLLAFACISFDGLGGIGGLTARLLNTGAGGGMSASSSSSSAEAAVTTLSHLLQFLNAFTTKSWIAAAQVPPPSLFSTSSTSVPIRPSTPALMLLLLFKIRRRKKVLDLMPPSNILPPLSLMLLPAKFRPTSQLSFLSVSAMYCAAMSPNRLRETSKTSTPRNGISGGQSWECGITLCGRSGDVNGRGVS